MRHKAKMIERLKKIEKYEKLKKGGAMEKSILEVLEISRATYYRWKSRYKWQGVKGLKPISSRPKSTRTKVVLTKYMITKIKEIRNRHKMYGKAKIHSILRRQGEEISESSVGRGLKYLASKNLIERVVILKCQKERKYIRKYTRHAQRIKKGQKGQIQIDHMIINLKGVEHRQFNAIDRYSGYCVSRVYGRAGSEEAADFLKEVIEEMPIKIRDIQADGGSEFRGAFERSCEYNKIPLLILPPRSPEMNGKVERLNQTWQDEFYLMEYNELPTERELLNKEIKRWQKYYNEERVHRSLKDEQGNLLTPLEALNALKERQKILQNGTQKSLKGCEP